MAAVVELIDKVFVGDIGTGFRGTFKEDSVAVDISAATTKTISFEKPNGETIVRAGSFFTDGTDGILEYVTVDGDLDIGGDWRLQGRVIFGGWNGRSDIVKFKVFDNLT